MSEHAEPPQKKRRRRPALSCEHCRRRKTKCDRAEPCGPCVQARYTDCTYSSRPSGLATSPTAQFHSPASHDGHFKVAPQLLASSNSLNSGPQFVYQTPPYRTPQSHPNGSETDNSGQPAGLGGTLSKTRLFGQSHWMHSFGRFGSIISCTEATILNKETFKEEWMKTEILAMMRKCKSMAKTKKLELHKEWLRTPELDVLVPSRDLSDTLINLYFSTGESLYRILHFPSFKRDYLAYWENPSSASSAFILQMLLAMANGACFYQEADAAYVEAQSKKWVYAGQHWLSQGPDEKSRLNIAGIQVHCLVILARQIHGIVGDLAWVSVGTLLRAGISMGLQRDPKYFPRMTPLYSELRRRLWATILELNVQLSLDMGTNPMITTDDFDALPPSNIDDDDVDDGAVDAVSPKSDETFTQTTVQRILLESFPLRLRVCRLINSFRGEPSYETVLELGAQLIKACKDAMIHNRAKSTLGSTGRLTQLQQNLLDISIRRFLLLLHSASCIKSFKDPRFHFSRKVCLDSATIMTTYPTNESGDTTMPLDSPRYDHFTLLKVRAQDFFKRVMIHGCQTILHDLFQEVEDEADLPYAIKEHNRKAREPYKQIIRDAITLMEYRIPFAENNVKGHLFMSAVYGQLEAMEQGTAVDMGAVSGAQKSARICLKILTAGEPESMRYSNRDEDGRNAQEMPTPPDQNIFENLVLEDWNGGFDGLNSWPFSGMGEF